MRSDAAYASLNLSRLGADGARVKGPLMFDRLHPARRGSRVLAHVGPRARYLAGAVGARAAPGQAQCALSQDAPASAPGAIIGNCS